MLRHGAADAQLSYAYVDWVQAGAVGPVRDAQRETCKNADHFYAMTESLEAQQYLSTGVLTQLSAQQMMDCYSEASGVKTPCNMTKLSRPNFDDIAKYMTQQRSVNHWCYRSMSEQDYPWTGLQNG